MRPNIIYTILSLLLIGSTLHAQVGINTDDTNPDPSAMLDVKSTDKGMLIPRLTSAQREAISNPATGLLVFDTETESFWFKGSSGWVELSDGKISQMADADNDTKIQVEESADEDIIRFDIGGAEAFRMEKTAGGFNNLEFLNNGGGVFIGNEAGNASTTPNNFNTFIGDGAGSDNDGYQNTYLGWRAGDLNTSGNNNTFIGASAGRGSSGGGNVFIGFRVGESESGSNKLFIDNGNTANPLIYGEFNNNLIGINGDMGVGTQSPQDKLHVAGSIRMVDGNQAAGYIPVSDANGTMTWTDPTTVATADDGDWITSGNDIYSSNSGNVGVGTSTPEAPFHISKNNASGQLLVSTASNFLQDATILIRGARNSTTSAYQSQLKFQNYDDDLGATNTLGAIVSKVENATDNVGDLLFLNSTDGSTLAETMRLTKDGNVGVGTASPSEKLHVEGSIRMVDGNQAAGYIPVSDANGRTLRKLPGIRFQGLHPPTEPRCRMPARNPGVVVFLYLPVNPPGNHLRPKGPATWYRWTFITIPMV